MNNAVAILLLLLFLSSALKISLWKPLYALILAAAWCVLIALFAPWLSTLAPAAPYALLISPWCVVAIWLEGALMIAYCVSSVKRPLLYRLLSFYPGLTCGLAFYFLLIYSFKNFLDSNFALCGIIVGALAGCLLMALSVIFRLVISKVPLRIDILFATEIMLLLLTALIDGIAL